MSRSVRVICWVLSASALASWWVVDTFLGPKHAVAFPVGVVAIIVVLVVVGGATFRERTLR
jgi:hypothetical protein